MFIAVDVGNSHLSFSAWTVDRRLETVSIAWSRQHGLFVDPSSLEPTDLGPFLTETIWKRFAPSSPRQSHDPHSEAPISWWIASVNQPASTALQQGLRVHRPLDLVCSIDHELVPLADDLLHRQRTGIDRLLAAWFASQFLISPATRQSSRGTIVVDVGSAVTVDWVDPAGVFRGGMIYPGFRLSATALHRETAALPMVSEVSGEQAPPPVGRGTIGAMEAGLFWSQWGGLCEAIAALTRVADDRPPIEVDRSPLPTSAPAVVVTGGGVQAFAKLLPSEWLWEPDLMPKAILTLAEQISKERAR
ncbi:MAG: type III pantothenate kinase [Planctomycetaceae bacterium]|nr:type III pantothenate kinase [Planctomycetaceae bacterium]